MPTLLHPISLASKNSNPFLNQKIILYFHIILQTPLYQLFMYQFCQINSKTISICMSSKEHTFTVVKPKWTWSKVVGQLVTRVEGKAKGVTLGANTGLYLSDEEGGQRKLRVQVSLDIEKSLQFDGQIGWNWHKSSNLPIISLKVELQDPEDHEKKYQQPMGLQARIFAVKIVGNSMEKERASHLEDVGLRGNDTIEVREGVGIFNGVRFRTTSYINQGVKFHLLVVLFLKNEEQGCEFRSIISSVISPAIFVDSRKSARDHFEKRFVSFTHVFDPTLMQRQFLKKSIKDKAQEYEKKVENSVDGLYNYLTAPNIRHKVKHPLFLSVKFSNAFQILFNTKNVQFGTESNKMRNIIFLLQQILASQTGRRRKSEKMSFQIERTFLVNVVGQCSSIKRAKIYECLDFLNCNSMELVKYSYQISPHFKNIFQAGDVIGVYSQAYEELKMASSTEFEAKEEEEDEEENQNEEEEQRSVKEQAMERERPRASRQLPEIRQVTEYLPQQTIPLSPIYNPNPPISLLSNYSSILQQIDLQNYLLLNLIQENNMLRHRLLSGWGQFPSCEQPSGQSEEGTGWQVKREK